LCENDDYIYVKIKISQSDSFTPRINFPYDFYCQSNELFCYFATIIWLCELFEAYKMNGMAFYVKRKHSIDKNKISSGTFPYDFYCQINE